MSRNSVCASSLHLTICDWSIGNYHCVIDIVHLCALQSSAHHTYCGVQGKHHDGHALLPLLPPVRTGSRVLEHPFSQPIVSSRLAHYMTDYGWSSTAHSSRYGLLSPKWTAYSWWRPTSEIIYRKIHRPAVTFFRVRFSCLVRPSNHPLTCHSTCRG
jgi:hypothetical protein